MNDVIREFLIETHENLGQLDLDLVALEKDPTERATLSRVFRTLHTVKGSAGFLGLQKLQTVAHAAENLLSRLRAGELTFNPEIASALLAVVDAVRQMLQAVEASETDGSADYSALIHALDRLRVGAANPASLAPPAAPTPPPPVEPVSPRVAEPSRVPLPQPPPVGPPTDATIIAAAAPAGETLEGRASAVSESSIRVDVGLLDKLMNLVGELVLARNQVLQFSASQEDSTFMGTVQRLNLLTTELQAGVMKTRMQPISNIWSKFPRVVRDLATTCGKKVRLEMEGQDTELDKTIVEAVRDPLTHLVRNAVDHGIEAPKDRLARGKSEEGRLALRAFHEGGKVIIEISDDGSGLDLQRIRTKAVHAKLITAEQADRLSDREVVNLLFLPGFSTADKVTQFSGRGVGLDVVRTNVERIGGTVSIENRPGAGTTILMKIPLTLAIIPALTITCAHDRYAIPQVSVLELVCLEGKGRGVESIHGAPVYRLRGNLLPLVYLNRELHDDRAIGVAAVPPAAAASEDAINIVVLQAEDRQFGLVVDAIHDTEEIVVKPLSKQLKAISVFSGATIMGDGKVALILDVLGLAQRASVVSGARERALGEKQAAGPAETGDRQTVLLFSTRDRGRMAIPLALVSRLEEFPRSAVERVGPQEVVQYRDEILPLVDIAKVLSRKARSTDAPPRGRGRTNRAPAAADGAVVPVVVLAGHGQHVGLVVEQILDIAEETLVVRSRAHRPGVLFTAVIQGRVTEFLDVGSILQSVDPIFLEQPAPVAVES